jgi:hypothetical protein
MYGALRLTAGVVAGSAAASAVGGAAETEEYNPTINPADFVTLVDNPYLPFVPGTTFVYEANTDEGHEKSEVVVTHETRVILGVTCTVIRHTASIDGKVVEVTLDWYTQDKDGAVWYFGEGSKAYRKGKVVGTSGSWEAGVNGAKPGILMEAHPKVGGTYHQEYARGVAEDMATVVGLDASATVPYGSFDGCLKTKEFSPLEPGVVGTSSMPEAWGTSWIPNSSLSA